MHMRVLVIAALVSAISVATAGRAKSAVESALERADMEWDAGDYISALSRYQELLAGPDAVRALEPIALQTGELYRSFELTTDGANPGFSADGRRFSFETGASIVAGDVIGIDRTTHIRSVDRSDQDFGTLPGGPASFCPDGRHVAWLRTAPTPEIAQASVGIAGATGAERAARLLALSAAIARSGRCG